MNKVYPSADDAVADIPDGASIAIAGFFTAGTPVPLIQALSRQGAKNLTIICQEMGPGKPDISQLVINKQIKKAICNYPFHRSVSRGVDNPFEQAVRAGEIEMEVYPMGTFVEKIRAGGAGLAGFYTPTGVGTAVAKGKETKEFEGREYLLELAIKPDYAFVYAYQGDSMGNLICRKTARNFNPTIAAAGSITIAAVEYLLEAGELDPDTVHVPGTYVQRVVEVGRPSYFPSAD